MKSPPRIRVIGSINLDIVARVPTLPRPGETVSGGVLAHYPGGKGANQALAARKLGAEVSMFGCVGKDGASEQALALLKSNQVDLQGVTSLNDVATGVALIAVDAKGENQIVVAPGANAAVSASTLADLRGVYDTTLCQLELPIETIAYLADTVTGLLCINLAPAQPLPKRILDRADILVVNETEAAFYGDQLHGSKALIIQTLGAAGAVAFQNGKEIARSGSPAVVPVDTTGAGDTFVGAFMVAFLSEGSVAKALTYACAAGAAATLTAGAQTSMPSRDQVEALLGATA
ncbi:ribokinase [Aquidulcibacter sp.]|uniref:ribokinase n=1 Tax=Aquidulcibacter sp. TaxID=2052990 RepID=UPI0025C0D678|nr:ribokinase [Aquidulcibacter sp.]MCA3697222.1 ribokinase [Aquidulcibacter sp.]